MLYAIGDIHGCLKALKALLGKLPLRKGDEIVFLGDYIDRGPESRGVVEFLLSERTPQWHFLRGNHEQLVLDWLETDDPAASSNWLINGGSETLKTYADPRDMDELRGKQETDLLKTAIPAPHVEFFRSTAFFRDTPFAYFCHAGVNLDKPLFRQSPDDLLWIRRKFADDPRPTPKLVVHGHTPVKEVDLSRDRINLDTGCVYGGHLTALSLPERKLYQSRQS